MAPKFDLASVLAFSGAFMTVLKMEGMLDLSWWWVLAPVWVPLALAAVAIGITMALTR